MHVLSAEVLEVIPAHQLVAKRYEDPFFHLLAADGQPVRAITARAGTETREAVSPVHDIATAAFGASRETGVDQRTASNP